jgi:predicted HAD superfamily Cof-like phosphohydrolase
MNSDQHSTHDNVAEFHRVFGVAINQPASRDLRTLRARLIAEEANEVTAELARGNLASIAHELADLVYVAYGTAISLGIDLDAAVAEVHRANMSKLDDNGQPIYRSDGKVLKSHNYRKPDCRSAVLDGAPRQSTPTAFASPPEAAGRR